MSTLYIFCTYYMSMMKERRNNKTEVNLPQKYPKLQHTQRLHTSIRFKSLRCLDKHGSLVVLFLPSNIYIQRKRAYFRQDNLPFHRYRRWSSRRIRSSRILFDSLLLSYLLKLSTWCPRSLLSGGSSPPLPVLSRGSVFALLFFSESNKSKKKSIFRLSTQTSSYIFTIHLNFQLFFVKHGKNYIPPPLVQEIFLAFKLRYTRQPMPKNCILVQSCGTDILMVSNMNDSRMMAKSRVTGQLLCGRNDRGDQISPAVPHRRSTDYKHPENERLIVRNQTNVYQAQLLGMTCTSALEFIFGKEF